ncbi:MAG: hypothetical protein JWN25_2548 [Verrucomicrobiales bacterium]|nr:hypothetical protein [Verrucomicrobiales bacterium]
MTSIILLKVLAVFVLVLLNGFFVAAEFALVKIRDTQLQSLIDKGNRQAKQSRYILANLDTFLSASQLGITLASLALGWIGEPVFSALLEPVLKWMHAPESIQHYVSLGAGFCTITFLHIVAGEQAPKWLAIQNPLPTTLWISYPLVWFYKISFPFIWGLNHSAQWLLRKMGMEPVAEGEIVHSEEELRVMFSMNLKHSGGTAIGRNIVLNALDLKRRIARDVMRPRIQISFLDTEASTTECIDVAEKSRYSRLPLCEGGDLDRMLGVVHIKDLYSNRLKVKKGAELAGVAKKIVYIPENARLEKVLQLLLERKLHFAIVVDEYGGTVGMFTLENILEELVGQIQDEFDQEKPMITKVQENCWEIAGELPLHDLSEIIGEELEEENVSTTSGWVTQKLGGFPKQHDKVRVGHFEIEVEEADGTTVSRLTMRKDASPTPGVAGL